MSADANVSASSMEADYYLSPDELTRCLEVVKTWRENQEQFLVRGGRPTMEPATPPPEYFEPSPDEEDAAAANSTTTDTAADKDQTPALIIPAAVEMQPPQFVHAVGRHASSVALVGSGLPPTDTEQPVPAESMPPAPFTNRGRAAYKPQNAGKQFLLTTGGRTVPRYGYGSRPQTGRTNRTSQTGGSVADMDSMYGGGGRSDAATIRTTATGRTSRTSRTARTDRSRGTTKSGRTRDEGGSDGPLRPWRSMGAIRRYYFTDEAVPALPRIYRQQSNTPVDAAAPAAPVTAATAATAATATVMQEHAAVDWTQSDEQKRAQQTNRRPDQKSEAVARVDPEKATGPTMTTTTATTTTTTKVDARSGGLLRRIKSRWAVGGGGHAASTAAPPVPASEKTKPSFLSFIGFRADA